MSELEQGPNDSKLLKYILESNEAVLVVLMRLYDVQMTLLAANNPEQAAALEKLHESGQVLSSMPYLNISEEDSE